MRLKYCIAFVTSMFFCIQANAEELKPYRQAHNETCYEIKEHKIPCGNFRIASTLLSNKYKYMQTGKDVADSFSPSTHPGDHPFLKRLAVKLGYVDVVLDSQMNNPISIWPSLSDEQKNRLLYKYSSIATTPELNRILHSYINMCLSYWSHPEAEHDKRMQLPTLSEVSALCIADSGVLDSRAP